ncbi:clathrin interactor 1-like isoform X2 [Amphibalanus amphitrite]|uniref:clathrin interactor 1-like isoform X2 n=1 Tax=Amphibalanus amphitrite TaxID=1232801 RepID=UPI001C926485|nr:clathrin interactor 1-like isoform X2 [Amphibalanus amphitrite]
MWKVREIADKVTNMVMNYTEVESKVREATNDEAWGPTGPQMQEVAQYTFTYEQFPEAMGMLWKRMLQDNRSNWRRTYKSLLLLHYLIRNGSERVVTSAREHIYDLRSLENYTFVDEFGKDQGINIRHKVRDLIDFVQDDDRLREERKKSKKNKDKYIGLSNFGKGSSYDWDQPNWRKGRSEWDSNGDSKPYSDQREADSNSLGEPDDSDSEVRARQFTDSSPAASKSRRDKPLSTGRPAAAASAAVKADSTKKPELVDDLFGGDDDFNPRAGDPPAAATGSDFSQFAAAPPPAAGSGTDGFADFASAFGGGGGGGGSAPAPVPPPLGRPPGTAPTALTPPGGGGGHDLLGGMTPPLSAPAAPAPAAAAAAPPPAAQDNSSLLMGLSLGPPAAAQPSMDLFGAPPPLAPAQQPTSLPTMGGLDLLGSPLVPAPSSSAGLMSTASAAPAQPNSQNVGSTWSGLKGVDISLDSLTLSNKPSRAPQPSMNQLMGGQAPPLRPAPPMLGQQAAPPAAGFAMGAPVTGFGMGPQSPQQQQQRPPFFPAFQ